MPRKVNGVFGYAALASIDPVVPLQTRLERQVALWSEGSRPDPKRLGLPSHTPPESRRRAGLL